jgi:hypothetical protein
MNEKTYSGLNSLAYFVKGLRNELRKPLSISQRFLIAGIYLLIIVTIGWWYSPDWSFLTNTNDKLNAILIVTALTLILGKYVIEPYYTKPAEVLIRWVAVLVFLIGFNDKEHLFLYRVWFYVSFSFISSVILLLILHDFQKLERLQRMAVNFVCKVSRPEIIFFALYLDIVISFRLHSPDAPVLVGFGFLLVISQPIERFVVFVTAVLKQFKSKTEPAKFIGQIIGHESQDLFEVELTGDNPFRRQELGGKLVYLESGTQAIPGIVLSERVLLGKKWLQILSLRDARGQLITLDLKSVSLMAGEKTIFSKTNAVYRLESASLPDEITTEIEKNPVRGNFDRLIGTVHEGSTINKLRFNKLFTDELQKSEGIGEGTIIQTTIANEDVLYQIIDARTNEEILEFKDSHGFTIGTAQKLGKYISATHELNTVKWLPEIYSPIFLLNPLDVEYDKDRFIGKLPNTNYGIPIKNPDELVTHNTAILGILGIGKSCLTFELLQKLVATTNVKVFCIDITNQFAKEIPHYISNNLLAEFEPDILKAIKNSIKLGNPDNSQTWGNVSEYKSILEKEFYTFLDSEKRILILNPDWHPVEKANAEYRITRNEPLTVAQKARIISERIFVIARELGETDEARFLIVFEEAHSLIPEWNSISDEGDKNATNGTAKVILQGRKYGLGSFVVTQRTANISKSILNQCNTIFAMRVFDDTGKQFLENYIGSDYSNLLPSLEERHCVAIGKALKLKQPVIIELNDMNQIRLQPDEEGMLTKNPDGG